MVANPAECASSPLIVVAGPTGSGKSALAMKLAEAFGGEIVSCDSVAIYRGLDIGSAKPSADERTRIPHHCLDLLDPDQSATAGDYARAARAALAEIAKRGRLPIVAGGTGLYLRALLDGLAPSPAGDEALRERLRRHGVKRGAGALHRLLRRFDPRAAALIHPNDTPKLIRSLEVAIVTRQPQTEQWQMGRDPLAGFHLLQLGLNPPRAALYTRLNERASRMFELGLLGEAATLRDRFGDDARALGALGYQQSLAVLRGELGIKEAVAETQKGHRHYAKRQLTWFRSDDRIQWLHGFGEDAEVQAEAYRLVEAHLNTSVTLHEKED